jgi:predicted PurR-regulated permease PerM
MGDVTRRALGVGLGLGAVVTAAMVLWLAADVLLVLFGGVILGLTLRGTADWVTDHTRLPPAVAVIGVAVVVLGLVVAGGMLMADKLLDQAQELAARLPEAIASVYGWLGDRAWGRALVDGMPAPGDTVSAEAIGRVGGTLWQTLGAALGFLTYMLIVIFVALYVAMNPSVYRRGLLRLVPLERRPRAQAILGELGTALRRWFLGRLLLTVIIGAVTAGGLALLGVPMALALGVLAGILNFIPYLGPIVAFVPISLIALLESPMTLVWVLLLYVGVQELESHILTPLIQQQAVALPPAVIITAQVLLAMLVGIIGVLLATPLAAVVVILVRALYVEDVLGDSVDAPLLRPPHVPPGERSRAA